jgi:uncharacterized membrane protein YraQ (UPF0718 family)
VDKFFIAIAALLLVPLVLLFNVFLNIGVGIVVGWIVGIVLDDTWAKLAATTGWALEAWQTGGILAFVGSFFKTTLTNKSE